jgi:hypothetical protein
MGKKKKKGFWEKNKTILIAFVVSALVMAPLLLVVFDKVIR